MRYLKITPNLLAWFSMAGFSLIAMVGTAYAGSTCSVTMPYNPSYSTTQKPGTTSVADTYHTIIDHTQAEHPNVIVSNTETANGKSYPITSANVNPWAAIDGDVDYTSPSSDNRVQYREVVVDHAHLTDVNRTTTSTSTQGQGTYVHRLGTYDSGPSITALQISAGPPAVDETILDLFSVNGQAFDLDRLRYVANKLWKKWKQDVADGDG
ncbi:MAG: hypothetical protein ABUK11_04060, partial [Mariprofundaceae bacterium]